MRSATGLIGLSLATLLAASAAQAAGSVQVSFVQPEQFSDARDARRDSTETLRQLKSFLEEEAVRHLTDNQALTIEVLDVDLAGEVRYSSHLRNDVRVLKGRADWPRITLRYTLEAAGQPARRVEQTVADMAYLQRLNRYASGEPLRYEKLMLDEWFDAQFGSAAAK